MSHQNFTQEQIQQAIAMMEQNPEFRKTVMEKEKQAAKCSPKPHNSKCDNETIIARMKEFEKSEIAKKIQEKIHLGSTITKADQHDSVIEESYMIYHVIIGYMTSISSMVPGKSFYTIGNDDLFRHFCTSSLYILRSSESKFRPDTSYFRNDNGTTMYYPYIEEANRKRYSEIIDYIGSVQNETIRVYLICLSQLVIDSLQLIINLIDGENKPKCIDLRKKFIYLNSVLSGTMIVKDGCEITPHEKKSQQNERNGVEDPKQPRRPKNPKVQMQQAENPQIQGENPQMQHGENPQIQQGENPQMQQGRHPRMYHGNPQMQQGRQPRMHQGNQQMQQGENPQMQQGRHPRMHQGNPQMQQGENPQMHQGNPQMQQGRHPRMHHGNPQMQQGRGRGRPIQNSPDSEINGLHQRNKNIRAGSSIEEDIYDKIQFQ